MSWSHVRLRDCIVRLEISSVYGYYDINSVGLKNLYPYGRGVFALKCICSWFF
jgi:hypothetical protein